MTSPSTARPDSPWKVTQIRTGCDDLFDPSGKRVGCAVHPRIHQLRYLIRCTRRPNSVPTDASQPFPLSPGPSQGSGSNPL